MTTESQIEEILYEAHAYGMRKEVLQMASDIIRDNPKINKVMHINSLYNKIVEVRIKVIAQW